jgi:hypothetical protein
MVGILFSAISNFSLFAQTDTVNALNQQLQLWRLKEGKSVYLVYFTDSLFKMSRKILLLLNSVIKRGLNIKHADKSINLLRSVPSETL